MDDAWMTDATTMKDESWKCRQTLGTLMTSSCFEGSAMGAWATGNRIGLQQLRSSDVRACNASGSSCGDLAAHVRIRGSLVQHGYRDVVQPVDGELEQLFGGSIVGGHAGVTLRDRLRQGLDTRISAERLVLTMRDPIAVARDLMSQHLGLVLVGPYLFNQCAFSPSSSPCSGLTKSPSRRSSK